MPIRDEDISRAISDDTLRRGLLARMQMAMASGEKLVEEHRARVAETLLHAGLHLIPSDHLQDHQFVVSRGIYEAARTVGAKEDQ
jgi:hypothetical protein